MSFGIPVRNGVGVGLAASTSIRTRSGGAPIIPTAPLYSENFAYADGFRLVSGDPNANAGQVPNNPGTVTPNWTAISKQAATTNQKYNPIVVSGAVTQRTANALTDFTAYNGISTAGKYLLSPVDIASTDQFVQFTATANTAVSMAALATDEVNHIRLNLTSTAFNMTSYLDTTTTSAAALSGGATARFNGGISNGTFKRPAAGDVITILTYAGTAYLHRGNATIGLVAGYSVSAVTGTRVGFVTYNGSFQDIDNIRAGVLTGKLFITDQVKAYPRVRGLGGFANGGATVAISGTYLGTAPTGLQWALFDPETGALVKDWVRVSGPTIGSGNWSGSIIVPCGANGVKPYRLAVRAENDTWNIDFGRIPFYVTVNILGVGQSNMSRMAFNNSSGVTDHPGGVSYVPGFPSTSQVFPTPTTSWETGTVESTAADTNIGRFTQILSVKLGLPVQWSTVAISSRGAAALNPAIVNSDGTWIRTHLGFIGAFDAILLFQGENEINVSVNTTEAQAWKAQWRDTNLPGYRSYSQQPTGVIPVFYGITGKYTSATSNVARDAAIILRQAQSELAAEVSDSYVAAHPVGLTFAAADPVHFSANDQTGYYKLAERFALSVAKQIAAGSFDGRGPRCTSATRSGADITLPVTLNGADSIAQTTGGDLTGWEFSTTSNFASLLTISSIVLTGNDVVATLSASPGAPVYCRFFVGTGGMSDAVDTNCVVGTYSSNPTYYSGTIELEPIAPWVLSN
jgi:hypothetical protein